jgi:phosphatidylglycerophosphatase C
VGAPDLAVFDLDGTLTRGDTFLPFLRHAVGSWRMSLALLRAAPQLWAAWRDRSRRDHLKEVVLRSTLRGIPAEFVDRAGSAYADRVFAKQLRSDMVARLRWHQAQGHDCVIASASLTAYVQPLADRLGIERTLATDLEVGPDGLLTGRISGVNCRAGAKLDRLEAAYGTRPIAWAYGDSVDDQAVLERAAHPTLVGKLPVVAAGAS